MSDIRCGTCRHYAPAINSDTGRVLTSNPGDCRWPMPNITYPISYTGGSSAWKPLRSLRWVPYSMYHNEGKGCPCWSESVKAKLTREKKERSEARCKALETQAIIVS